MKKTAIFFLMLLFNALIHAQANIEINLKDCVKCTITAKLLMDEMDKLEIQYVLKFEETDSNQVIELLHGKQLLMVYFGARVPQTKLVLVDTIIPFIDWHKLKLTQYASKLKQANIALEGISGKWRKVGYKNNIPVLYNQKNGVYSLGMQSLLDWDTKEYDLLQAHYRKALPDTNYYSRIDICNKLGIKNVKLKNVGVFDSSRIIIGEFYIPNKNKVGEVELETEIVALTETPSKVGFFKFRKPTSAQPFAYKVFQNFEFKNDTFLFSNYQPTHTTPYPAFTKIADQGKNYSFYGSTTPDTSCNTIKGGFFLNSNNEVFFIDALTGRLYKNYVWTGNQNPTIFKCFDTDSGTYITDQIIDFFDKDQKMYVIHETNQKYVLYQVSAKGQFKRIAETHLPMKGLFYAQNNLVAVLENDFEQTLILIPL